MGAPGGRRVLRLRVAAGLGRPRGFARAGPRTSCPFVSAPGRSPGATARPLVGVMGWGLGGRSWLAGFGARPLPKRAPGAGAFGAAGRRGHKHGTGAPDTRGAPPAGARRPASATPQDAGRPHRPRRNGAAGRRPTRTNVQDQRTPSPRGATAQPSTGQPAQSHPGNEPRTEDARAKRAPAPFRVPKPSRPEGGARRSRPP